MSVSKKQQASVNKYIKEHYDVVRLLMPKGNKAVVKKQAEKQGVSVNSYINSAIEHELSRTNKEV